MIKPKNMRKRIFANKFHKDIFLLLFMASLIPTLAVTAYLYHLILTVIALKIDERVLQYNLVFAVNKATLILIITAPVIILGMLLFTNGLTHSIVGPFDRLIDELDKHIEGKKEGGISIRRNDKFRPLVDKINKLLDRLKKG
ncbi:MAG: hypothetical protein NTW64_03225 [Candidatus Omnitrophica bacterium]|nr:hypothetical protein [Candidatus Omnitrophota bacterium]